MKKTIIAMAACLFVSLLPFCGFAAEEEKAADRLMSVSTSVTHLNRYVGPEGLIYDRDNVTQVDMTLSLPKGFYLNAFVNKGYSPITECSGGEPGACRERFAWSDEIDWKAGWTGDYILGTTLNCGVAYYDLNAFRLRPRYWTGTGYESARVNDYIVVFYEVSSTMVTRKDWSLSGRSRIETYLPYKSGTDGGILYSCGLDYSYTATDKLSLLASLTVAAHDGVWGLRPGQNAQGKIGFEYKVLDNVSMNAWYTKVLVFQNEPDGACDTDLWSVGFTVKF
jgi:hypothetical protein